MAKATTKPATRTIGHKPEAEPVRRFLNGPVCKALPVQRTVQTGSVDVDAHTLSAVAATNASRLMDVWDHDIYDDVIVEEVVLVAGGLVGGDAGGFMKMIYTGQSQILVPFNGVLWTDASYMSDFSAFLACAKRPEWGRLRSSATVP
jgi:hypothetical protein